MPLYSAFTPFGHLRFKRRESRFRVIYQTMRDDQDGAYGPNDVHQEARVYAAARCVATAYGEIERADNEGRPLKTQQLLSTLERDYGLAPRHRQSRASRRATLAAHMKVVRGSRKEALEEALGLLLGADFVAAIPNKDIVAPPAQWPADPADTGNYSAGATWRLYRLQNSVSVLGAQAVTLVDMVPNQSPLKAGEVIVIDSGHNGLAETVTVTGFWAAPSTDTDGITQNRANATFANPHDAGVVCTTAPFPNQGSTQRHITIQVSLAAATDPQIRASIDRLMRRIVRGVTTWSITVAPPNVLSLGSPTQAVLGVHVLA